MSQPVPRPVILVVRSILFATPRQRSARVAEMWMQRYLDLGRDLTDEQGRTSVRVPPMNGVDPEMRRWSYFQLLEHNAIVNRAISELVHSLALGEEPGAAAQIDPKKDVLPGTDCGPEARDHFRESVLAHRERVKGLPALRKTATRPHPVFGPFDAHRWNGMFPLHLRIHWRQARAIVRQLGTG